VAGRKHHPASAGMPDDHGLGSELRPVALLDRGVERIAIDMGNAQSNDLGVLQEAAAAATAARWLAVDDLAAIPAQRLRHGRPSMLMILQRATQAGQMLASEQAHHPIPDTSAGVRESEDRVRKLQESLTVFVAGGLVCPLRLGRGLLCQ